MQKKAGSYPFFQELVKGWKPRAKKIKLNLKDLAQAAEITPPHLTKIVTGKVKSPPLDTMMRIEASLRSKEAGL